MQTNEQLLLAIENYLAQTEFPAEPERLYAPIGYSLAGGGKRLRPMLLMLAHGIFTDRFQAALPAAAAVEVFHNFTLLHDTDGKPVPSVAQGTLCAVRTQGTIRRGDQLYKFVDAQ